MSYFTSSGRDKVGDQTISVKGKEIPYEFAELDISKLRFYPENPRINYILTTHAGEVTQDVIEQELLKLEATKDLVKDIEANGGLLEEILVIADDVVEGNTRLACYRKLHRKNPEDPRWRTIPAKVLSSEMRPDEIFFVLATFHVKGKNEWSAYEKAAYIHRMIRELQCTPGDVAKQLGHQAKTVEAMLAAYEAMSTHFLPNVADSGDAFEVQDALHKYSYFEAMYRQKDLAKRAEQTPAFAANFSEWVRQGVFPKAECVRDLPKILNHKRAQNTFMELIDTDPGSAFEEATYVLHEAKPEKVEPFYKAVDSFRSILGETPPAKVRAEIDQDGTAGTKRKYILKRCLRDLQHFCHEIGLDD
jgi:hypothetical protein